jgi:hypothetical protein
MKGSKDLKKNKIEEKYDIRYNEIRNQYKGSECGVYSLNFIIRLLHNPDFDNIIKQQVPDDTINKCREIYFENQDINSEKSINIIQNGYNQQLLKQQLLPENYFQLRAESFINNKNSSFNLIPLDEKLKRKNNETVMNRRILLPEKRENTIDNKIQLKKYFSNHIDSNFKIGVTHNKSFVSYLI